MTELRIESFGVAPKVESFGAGYFGAGYILWEDGLLLSTHPVSPDDLETPELLAYAQQLRDEYMRKHCAVTDGAR